MTRQEIDKAIRDKCRELNIPQHMIRQQESPAEFHILVGEKVSTIKVSTRMTKRALDDALTEMEILVKQQAAARAQHAERLAAKIGSAA